MTTLRAACVQMTSGRDPAINVGSAARLIRAAAADGAQLIATPEVTNLMELDRGLLTAKTATEADDEGLAALCALAAELGVWLLIGSFSFHAEGDGRLANRSLLVGPDGAVAARYDKIHMFDVDLPSGDSPRESRNFRPGETAVVAETPWARIGLTVCYDVRFPHLYRRLAKAGAQIITIPAAFTRVTGEAHWHVLVRARAIETGAFVLAPAQTGNHEDGRKTFGHSLIVDPWGRILAEAGTERGHIIADLDLDEVARVRRSIPSLANERDIAGP